MENLFSFLDKGVGALVLNGFDGEVLRLETADVD